MKITKIPGVRSMGINDLFAGSVSKDVHERAFQYSFDGSVEEFLEKGEGDKEVISLLKEVNHEDLRIVVDLKMDLSQSVTNQIIHYKDAFKVENPALRIPYFVYGKKDEREFGIILMPNEPCGYLYGKALYYCLTEKEGPFDQCMNSIVSLFLDPDLIPEIKKSIEEVMGGEVSLGYIQRNYDRMYVGFMNQLKETSIVESNRVFDEAQKKLLDPEAEKAPIINDAITRCFLLKKCMYVHFMKSKNLLNSRYDGDIKKLRSAAKEASDAIPFVSYSELWRYRENSEGLPKVEQEQSIDIYAESENMEHAETPEEFAKRVLGIDTEDKTEE